MSARTFVLLGLTMFLSAADAQQSQRVHRVGVLNFGFPGYSILASPMDVLLVYPDALTMQHRKEIAGFAIAHRLPAIFAYKEYAEAGA